MPAFAAQCRPKNDYGTVRVAGSESGRFCTDGQLKQIMVRLIPAEDFDGRRLMKDVPATSVTPELRQRMRELDEGEDLEPLLRLILADDNPTRHGPAEIAGCCFS